jgi:hypothetical protein
VEEERRRRRDRELAAARDAEIRDLVQRTRYLTTEVEEFVGSGRYRPLWENARGSPEPI